MLDRDQYSYTDPAAFRYADQLAEPDVCILDTDSRLDPPHVAYEKVLQVGRAFGLHTVGLTGRSGGKLKAVCDATICVPWERTADVQERHLAIYHALCAMLEGVFFPQ